MADLQVETRLGKTNRFSAVCVDHTSGFCFSDEAEAAVVFELLSASARRKVVWAWELARELIC